MRALWLVPFLALVAACGSPASTPSSWQRFDALRPQLDAVTRASSAVALDASHIRTALSRGQSSEVRAWSARARTEGLSLSTLAGSAGNRVRSLVASASRNSTERRYLALVLNTLEQQWIEGRRIAALCGLLQSDPLLMSPADMHSFLELRNEADNSARVAVADVSRANDLRKRERRVFRYVPVRLAGATANGS